MDDRTYEFSYYQNEAASRKYGKALLTVRWQGEYYLTESVLCDVPTWTQVQVVKVPSWGRRLVTKGRASDIDVTYPSGKVVPTDESADYLDKTIVLSEVLLTHDI